MTHHQKGNSLKNQVAFQALILMLLLSGAASQAPAQGVTPPAPNVSFWLCRAMEGTDTYISGVIGPLPNGAGAYTAVIRAFREFVHSKYNLSATRLPLCASYGTTESLARDALHRFASQPGGGRIVQTGWTYTAAQMASDADRAGQSGQPAVPVGHDGAPLQSAAPTSGASYHCYYSIVLPSDPGHRTMYTDAPFESAAPNDWLTFWWSEYILSTYRITNANNVENACERLTGTPAVQQARIQNEETNWAQHNYRIVPVHWVLSDPVPPDVATRNRLMQEARLARMQPDVHPVGFCMVPRWGADDRRPEALYLSSFFSGTRTEINMRDDAALTTFSAFVEKQYERNNPRRGSCRIFYSMDQAKQAMDAARSNALKSIDTGWTRGGS